MAFIREKDGLNTVVTSLTNYTPQLGDAYPETQANNTIEDYLWNGSYWLSKATYEGRISNDITATMEIPLTLDLSSNLFLKDFKVNYRIASTNTTARYWKFHLFRVANDNTWTWMSSIQTDQVAPNLFHVGIQSLNLYLDLAATNTKCLMVQAEKISTPGSARFNAVLTYQKAKIG